MTFGEQNTQSEASEQLDYALENGVNFIDTAEITLEQLKANIDSVDLQLVPELLQKIEEVGVLYSNPSP